MSASVRRARGRIPAVAAMLGVFALCATTTLLSSNTVSAETLVTASAGAAAIERSTRFVIGLDREVSFRVSSLRGATHRVVVDLPAVNLRLPPLPKNGPAGLVKSFRGGLSAPGRTRIVIDVVEPVVVQASRIVDAPDGSGKRLELDIVPAANVFASVEPRREAPAFDAKAFKLGAGLVQPPLPQPAQRPEDIAAHSYKPVIVLDPGHGGHDSGAKKHGVMEKNVVLAFSHVLRELLVASGRYQVLMTRTDDTFVELDERRRFAERNKAALFIAIHADYASTNARGATIYSLRDGVANALRKSATGQVERRQLSSEVLRAIKSDSGNLGVVKGFFTDLAQREIQSNKARTDLFSRSVIEFMGQSTGLRDHPDRSAAFRVLKTAQVPAVLIELAYVSNKQDARLLTSLSWRRKVAQSIKTAVDNYFSHQMARLPM